MLAKRALVVDDSKSARAFLAKLLEEQQVEVDAAETAEQALDYLTHTRPDVIFMDHLMPGMDGFQAVQAIKGNPRTAGIPILMYTSQEGELYLGQARALGAVGVVSKNMASVDVKSVLQDLHLVALPEPAVEASPEAINAADSAMPSAQMGPVVEELLKAEMATLRQHMAEMLSTHSEQVVREVGSLIREATPAPLPPPSEPELPRQNSLPWVLALAASVAAAVVGTLLWQGQQQINDLRSELMDSRSAVALLTARLVPAEVPVIAESVAAISHPADVALVLQVPFGEQPLSGLRIEALRDFAARIAALEQKGTVEVRRYAGRFCLSGSSTEGYVLADGALPSANCDLVAEATDPVLATDGPESGAFATALAEMSKQYSALFNIDVGAGPATESTASQTLTAGEWNDIAWSNNRVEFRWHPAT